MLGQMASLNMQQLVRGFLVFELTGSYTALGTIYLANSVPGIALSAMGGVLADRVRQKKPVVQIGQLLNATNALVVGLLVWTGAITFEYLLVAAIAHGTVMSLMMPARQAMLPEVVGFDRLMNAVALSSAGMNATRLFGPAVAGLLIAALGAHAVYFIITGLYLYASVLLTKVTTAYAVELEPSGRGGSGVRDLVEGLRYMWSDQTMRVLLVFSSVFAMLAMPFQFLLPGFVAGVLHEGPDKLGLLMSAAGIGSLIGSLVVASLPSRRRGVLLIGSALWMSVALIAFSASTQFVATAVIMLVIGVGDAGRMSLGMVLVQAYTRDDFRGRVMSLFMMQRSFATFFTFFVGLGASLVGAPLALGALAAVLGVLALGMLVTPGLLRGLD
jgi:MFS family permease